MQSPPVRSLFERRTITGHTTRYPAAVSCSYVATLLKAASFLAADRVPFQRSLGAAASGSNNDKGVYSVVEELREEGLERVLNSCCLSAESAEKKVEEPVSSVPTAPVHSAKAKRKAALSKANAEGPKGGLLDAFTGPQPTAAEPVPEAAKETPKQAPVAAAKPAAPSPEKV